MFGKVLQSWGLLQSCWSRMRQRSLQDRNAGTKKDPAAAMLAERVGQPAHGWKRGLLHLSCTGEKYCHQLSKVEGRRERRSEKLREDCCFVLKTSSTRFFVNCILVQLCSDRFHYQLSTLRSIKYYSVFIPYEILKLLLKYST